MKCILAVAAVVVCALARPQPDVNELAPRILRLDNDRSENGEYSFSMELSDGTIRHEEGRIVDAGLETEHLDVSGFFEHRGPDGVLYRTDYRANTEGFSAEGSHLPKNNVL